MNPRFHGWRIAAAALALVVGACGSGGTAALPSGSAVADPATDQLARILTRGTLVGYAELDYPPQSIRVEGATRTLDTTCLANQLTAAEVTGYDVETTKLVAKALGVEPCFVSPTWTEITAGNWADRLDIAFGSGSINEDRMTRLWMTQPYYATPNRFFVREDSPYQTADELSGKQIGSCASCTHEAYLKRELAIPGVTLEFEVDKPVIVAYETEAPGLQDVADGKIAAFLAAEPVGVEAISEGLPLRALAKAAFTFYPSGFVDKSSGYPAAAFVGRVNMIIQAYQADGTMKALSLQWFGVDYATGGAEFDVSKIGQTVP